MILAVPGEAGQAFLGTAGIFSVAYYAGKELIHDFLDIDPVLRGLAAIGGGGTILLLFNMLKSIYQVESPSGARGAKLESAVSALQQAGILQKPEKPARPVLEIANTNGNGKKAKVKVSVK